MTNQQVAQAFVNQQAASAANLTSTGGILLSYGYHLAMWITDDDDPYVVVANTPTGSHFMSNRKLRDYAFSPTTNQHRSYVVQALDEANVPYIVEN